MKCCVRNQYTVHLPGQPPHPGGTILELTDEEYALRSHQVHVIAPEPELPPAPELPKTPELPPTPEPEPKPEPEIVHAPEEQWVPQKKSKKGSA